MGEPSMSASKAVQASCAETDQLKELLALHEAALATMSHGLCMVDAEQRLVLFNRRYLDMFDLAHDVARPGMPIAELIAHSAARGNFPAAQIEEIKRRRLDLMARGEPFRLMRQMSRGRTFAMDYRPLPGGGWVTLVEDVTARQREQYELAHDQPEQQTNGGEETDRIVEIGAERAGHDGEGAQDGREPEHRHDRAERRSGHRSSSVCLVRLPDQSW